MMTTAYVVVWYVLSTGLPIYSAPMSQREAQQIYHGTREVRGVINRHISVSSPHIEEYDPNIHGIVDAG